MSDTCYPYILAQHLADSTTVGEWDGQESRAAENINRLYEALYNALEDDIADEEYFHNVCHWTWDDWGSEEGLLELSDEQITAYVAKFFPRHG